ncbi:unnamed protein product, partial [Tetraodon nigroviridis]
IRCQRCREVCKGEVVRVQDTHFHVKCFTCAVCNCDLARSGFFQKKGEYICTADYQRLYGTRCDRCDSFITGEVVSALGRTYHPKCFVCSVCSKPFPIGDRVTFSGKDCMCQQCSHTLVKSNEPIKIHGPSHCAGCGDEIKQGQSLLALEKQWHVSCFRCRTCNMVLTGEYISKVKNEILDYKDLAALPKVKAIYEVQQPDLISSSCQPYNRYTSDDRLDTYIYGESLGTLSPYSQDYDSLDIKQRRCSSPGYIDSPTYSRQGLSPVIPRSPQHYSYTDYCMDAATKSRTSEDILRSSRLSTYSPEPYTQSECDYYPYGSSPKAYRMPRRRFSTGGDEESWSHSLQRPQSADCYQYQFDSSSEVTWGTKGKVR